MSKQLSLSWWIQPNSAGTFLYCEFGIDLEVWEADDENWEYYVQYNQHFIDFDILEVESVRFYLD